MQSRIYLGGFMQNQLPVQTLTQQEWDQLIGYINANPKPVETTKVGAIPANFFFSL
jgi:hypothetical protein